MIRIFNRKVAITISVLLVLGALFSGCSSDSTKKTSKTSKTENTQKEADKKPKKEEVKVDPVKLSLGVVVTNQDPLYAGIEQFKKNVEEKTNGAVLIELYPNSQLGDTKSMIDSIKEGKEIATIADAGVLSPFVPEIAILNAPYFFKTYDEGKKIVSSPEWKSIEDKLVSSVKMKVLSFNWYQGVRNVVTNKPINSITDLKGVKLRTIKSPVFESTLAALGAIPAGLPWADVYTKVKSKEIDGCEAQNSALYNAKLYEVLKYITKTSHIQLMTSLVTSDAWFQKVPEKYRDIVLTEAFNAGDVASKKTLEDSNGYEEKMKAAGVKINEIDTKPFEAATASVYDKLNFKQQQETFKKILGN